MNDLRRTQSWTIHGSKEHACGIKIGETNLVCVGTLIQQSSTLSGICCSLIIFLRLSQLGVLSKKVVKVQTLVHNTY